MTKKYISIVITISAIIYLIPATAFAYGIFRFVILPLILSQWIFPESGIFLGIYMGLFMALFLYISIGLWLKRQAARISAIIVSLILSILCIVSIINDLSNIFILMPILIINLGIIIFLLLNSVGGEFKK